MPVLGAQTTTHDEHDGDLAGLLAEVRRIDVLSRRMVQGVMAGGYTSVFHGAGIEVDEVREYVPGDDPRSIDWSVTARVGRPFVKTYVDERDLTVLFLLDLSASMDGGFAAWSARQMAARVLGCLAFAAVHNGDKVGLAAFSDDVVRYVPPAAGAAHALRIVRDTLALRAAARGTDLRPALEFATRALRRKAIVFVLSDFLAEGWDAALTLCARHHDVIAVRLLAPELSGPDVGLVRMVDPESGRRALVDWGSRRVRAAFGTHVGAWHAQTADALRRAGVDLMDVPLPRTRDPYAVSRPIVRFFRMRELRGRKR